MPISELNVLLSCHSLDDFQTYHTGEAAEGILAAFTALWHPALIAEARKLPTWIQSDDPPELLAGRLITVPQVVQDDMPGFFFSQAEQDGAKLVTGLHDREQVIVAALAAIQTSREPEEPASRERQRPEDAPPVDPSLAADFLALGFCFLQTEVLTRRMRYMSNLDEAAFERATLAAAQAAVAGNGEEARTQLTTAFNSLLESRGYYYPVDAYFLDLTLIAPTTIGAGLCDELAAAAPMNVLLSAATLEKMAAEEPATLAALKSGLEAGTVGLIGGEYEEADLPLMSYEEILNELQHAGKIYERLLGRRPMVFGRWRAGLTPVLPQILHECGFVGAMHFTLDGGGQFPKSERIKTAWSGLDGTTLNAITKPPLDAAQPETFLALSDALGDTMDHDFVATAVFAHWPGRASPFYGDLRRAAKYAAVLGKFATVEEYFRDTEAAGTQSKFSPDEYRSPCLPQAVAGNAADAISTAVAASQQQAQQQSAATVATMASALQRTPHAPREDEVQADIALHSATEYFATAWRGQASSGDSADAGYLVVNPLNFTRRVGIELSELPSLPEVASSVLAADDSSGMKRAVVEVPPLGFAWISGGTSKPEPTKPRRGKPQPIVGEDNTLRNEFCAVKIHPQTGGIQSIHDFRTRGNRLSQQLAICLPSPKTGWGRPSEPVYTIMAVDSIEVEQNDAVFGRIASRGRLVDPAGKALAQVRQVVSLWQGSRTIELEVELISLFAELTGDAWNSYLASRFAWSTSTADLRRSVHGCSVATSLRRFEAPEFVEIVDGDSRTAILCGGLPYHRRSSDRMLDTILKVRGETATRFRFGISIDAPHTWRAAQEMLVPVTATLQNSRPSSSPLTGWLFHVDAPNVAATHWSPLLEAGRVVGFRVRLLETEARRGQVRVRCFRPLKSAQRVDLSGAPRGELTIAGEAVACDIGPYEWIQIEAHW